MGLLSRTSITLLGLSVTAAKKIGGTVWSYRQEIAGVAKAGVKTGATVAATTGKKLAEGAVAAGGYLYDHRAEIAAGAAVAGSAATAAGKGALQLGCDAGSLAIYRDSRVNELRDKLRQQGLRYRAAVTSGWQETPAAESLAVGGSLLTDILRTGRTPEDVQKAYELAYPHVAENLSFAEEAARLHGQELVGLVNGVKGKLFEMKYVDYLNSGELPDG